MDKPTNGGRALQRVIRNAASILSSNVLIKASTFIIYALVARHAGAREFGQLSLALSLLYTFHIFAVAGLKTLTVREVAKDHSLASAYLYNGSILVIGTSIVSLFALLVLIQLMGYNQSTTRIILVLFIGLLPYALSQLCESVFQAWEKMHFIAYANGPMHISKAVAAFLLLTNSFDVLYVAYAVASAYWGILLIEWFILLRMGLNSSQPDPGDLMPSNGPTFGFMVNMVRGAATFLGIEGVYAINASIGIIVLSKLLTEEDVGVYSSALQVTVPLAIIINDVVRSVFPIMCRKYEEGNADLSWVAERLIEVLLVLILPAIVGISLLADQVLLLLYQNNEFLSASYLLRILVWWSLVNAVVTVLGQVLWASQREKQSLIIAITAVITSLAGNIIFIHLFGLVGVVFTAVLVAVITLIQHYIPVSELLVNFNILPIIWKPIVGVSGMALVLIVASFNTLFAEILAGVFVYAMIIVSLYIWSYGGIYQTKIRYQHLRLGI